MTADTIKQAYRERIRKIRKKRNLCQKCGRPKVSKTKATCEICLEDMRAASKIRRTRNKEAALLDVPTEMIGDNTVKLPARPTQAMPGSINKVVIMSNRVSNGRQPHHPKDLRVNSTMD